MAVLYAPNDDDPNFFLNFFDHLNDFKCDEVVIGGDFNLVLDLDIDKKRRSRQNTYRISENTERFLCSI